VQGLPYFEDDSETLGACLSVLTLVVGLYDENFLITPFLSNILFLNLQFDTFHAHQEKVTKIGFSHSNCGK
jgi:hypothetical protein